MKYRLTAINERELEGLATIWNELESKELVIS
jgi:hypothetical protein